MGTIKVHTGAPSQVVHDKGTVAMSCPQRDLANMTPKGGDRPDELMYDVSLSRCRSSWRQDEHLVTTTGRSVRPVVAAIAGETELIEGECEPYTSS